MIIVDGHLLDFLLSGLDVSMREDLSLLVWRNGRLYLVHVLMRLEKLCLWYLSACPSSTEGVVMPVDSNGIDDVFTVDRHELCPGPC
jgi:hypothetical protein